jgi:hypothetical protein
MFDMELIESRMTIEDKHEWRKWCLEIPFIDFPEEYSIQAIPPFGGAVARFVVKHKELNRTISVYLDCYDQLGIFGEPYWEMYPYEDDIYRTEMANIDDLLLHIKEEFERDN